MAHLRQFCLKDKPALMCLSLLNICDQTLGHTYTLLSLRAPEVGSTQTHNSYQSKLSPFYPWKWTQFRSSLWTPSYMFLFISAHQSWWLTYTSKEGQQVLQAPSSLLYSVHVSNERAGTESIKRECDMKAEDFWRSVSFTRSFDVNDRKQSYKTYFS